MMLDLFREHVLHRNGELLNYEMDDERAFVLRLKTWMQSVQFRPSPKVLRYPVVYVTFIIVVEPVQGWAPGQA